MSAKGASIAAILLVGGIMNSGCGRGASSSALTSATFQMAKIYEIYRLYYSKNNRWPANSAELHAWLKETDRMDLVRLTRWRGDGISIVGRVKYVLSDNENSLNDIMLISPLIINDKETYIVEIERGGGIRERCISNGGVKVIRFSKAVDK